MMKGNALMLVVITILLCIPAGAQIKGNETIIDSVIVSDSFFCINDSVTVPIEQNKLKEIEDVLHKLPGVTLTDDGDVYLDVRYRTKALRVLFQENKEIKFICSNDYSAVFIPCGPLNSTAGYSIGKMDGKGSRPLTAQELAQTGLIGIPIPLPEGETVESYLLKQPGVHKDDDGNIVYPNGRVLTPDEL